MYENLLSMFARFTPHLTAFDGVAYRKTSKPVRYVKCIKKAPT